jgi:hypothetical protein
VILKTALKNIFALSTCLIISGCMNKNPMLAQSASTAAEALGCSDFQSKVFDSMYSYLDQEKSAPDIQEFKAELSARIDEIALNQKIDHPEKISEFKNEINRIFEVLIEDSKNKKNVKSSKEHLQTLIQLEMQDTSSPENIKLNSKLTKQFSKVSTLSNELNIQCQSPAADNSSAITEGTSPDNIPVESQISTQSRMIAGQNNVFSTAYQSCQALQVPEISASTPDVVGIRRIGTHADGIGGLRQISSLSSVQNTHPYIKVAAGQQNGCFNVRANPLIYDYGGEPSIANNTINFFKNVGTGSKTTLGIDCSAYVSSAIAAAGFRYRPGVANKAIYIRQTSAQFINAKNSGFSCFDNITLTKESSIKPGDIGGVRGHVVMIDKVGADPFGIKKLSNVSQCATLGISNFDFTISQSSPTKNGVGIDKMIAKDYLAEFTSTGKMRVLFTGIARAACTAYFQNTSVKPNNSEWGIIRHNGTAECLAPRIQLENQSCVSQCQQ